MDSARSPGRSAMRTGIGIHLVVEVDDGTKHGMGVGMGCARGQSGRFRRDVRLVLGASVGVECCVGQHNLRMCLVRGSSRSTAAVMDGTNCKISRGALGNGDEGWALSTLFS